MLKINGEKRKKEIINNFSSFPNDFWSQPTKYVKLILSRFWGVLCESAHPESTIKHCRSFS